MDFELRRLVAFCTDNSPVPTSVNNGPETQQQLIDEILPRKVPILEKLLQENGTGFFVGNKLSIVDLSAFDVTEHVIDLLGQSYLESLPLLKAHYEQVASIEGIKRYLDSRPPREFNL